MEGMWPEVIIERVSDVCGTPLTADLLGGLSSSPVYRVCGQRGSVILKTNARPREAYFYRHIAPALARSGIMTPRLEFSDGDQDTWWLILEDIPHPFPRCRWDADAEAFRILARLHTLSYTPADDIPGLFRPQWSSDMSAAALAAFPLRIRPSLTHIVGRVEDASQSLFAPSGWIAGDPNPTNWGIRDDGALVMFDWERFGRGHPALDLAITIPGLGDLAAFRHVATQYIDVHPSLNSTAAQLTADIGRAKVWSVVDLLNDNHSLNNSRLPAIMDWLIPTVPDWIASIAPILK